MFKVGDKVICIDNRFAEDQLELGKEYTIAEIINRYVRVMEIDIDMLSARRFVPKRSKTLKLCKLEDDL